MRIIVADHHSAARKALVALLLEQPGWEVIGEAQEMDTLLELVTAQPAHVVLLDHDLPGDPLVEMIEKIHALDPDLIVIVMSSDPEHARQALSNHADAFVSKGDPPEWLLSVLKRYDLKEPMEKHEE
jgi:DNA-binding NarL/FixJ family response regulator